jgi:hypothetical protein
MSDDRLELYRLRGELEESNVHLDKVDSKLDDVITALKLSHSVKVDGCLLLTLILWRVW